MTGRARPSARGTAVALLVALTGVVAGCHIRGKKSDHLEVGADMARLRQAFNQELGHPRVVMLVAPT